MTDGKECFVICPIGSEESEERERADKLLKHIIRDAVGEYGYEAIRADELPDPGSISSKVIEMTVESDLVIVDLTGHNPNVFYELAVRHSTGKPYIQLIDSKDSIPFDIADLRTIRYDFDVESARRAAEDIQEQLELIEDGDPEFDTPISRAADLKSWRESGDPVQQNLAELLDGIDSLNKKMNELDRRVIDKEDMADIFRLGIVKTLQEGDLDEAMVTHHRMANQHKIKKEMSELEEVREKIKGKENQTKKEG